MARPRWSDPNRAKSPWLSRAEEDPTEHWKRKREARYEEEEVLPPPPGSILLGRSIRTGRDVYLPREELQTHMHVLGSTGVGKSFFIESAIKSLILDGEAICLIDPHGDLYHRIFDFCAYLNIERPDLALSDRVIPFDIADRQHVLGFNPIQQNAKVKVYQVVALMEAIRKCWGQGNFQETPRLARWLYNTIYAVIDSKMTFLQMQHMVSTQADNPYRAAITRRITSPSIRAEWDSLARKSEEKREDRVESCLNRIRPFVENEIIRGIIGQQKNTIDFHDVLGSGKIVLVNLAGQGVIANDDRHLLGTLLVNELLTAAFARKKNDRKPYYLFIDEFGQFVTKDICAILDGGRKFGLHLTLGHQHLAQLREKDHPMSRLSRSSNRAARPCCTDTSAQSRAGGGPLGELTPTSIGRRQGSGNPAQERRLTCKTNRMRALTAVILRAPVPESRHA